MTKITISMPDAMGEYVAEQIQEGRHRDVDAFFQDLVLRDRERHRLMGLLQEGAASAPGPVADDNYFERLRERIGRRRSA
ncbi:MAG: ribbon-helix-helix domain-containing protein [Pararhizobium sp.]